MRGTISSRLLPLSRLCFQLRSSICYLIYQQDYMEAGSQHRTDLINLVRFKIKGQIQEFFIRSCLSSDATCNYHLWAILNRNYFLSVSQHRQTNASACAPDCAGCKHLWCPPWLSCSCSRKVEQNKGEQNAPFGAHSTFRWFILLLVTKTTVGTLYYVAKHLDVSDIQHCGLCKY